MMILLLFGVSGFGSGMSEYNMVCLVADAAADDVDNDVDNGMIPGRGEECKLRITICRDDEMAARTNVPCCCDACRALNNGRDVPY